jgi:hypothetical protein
MPAPLSWTDPSDPIRAVFGLHLRGASSAPPTSKNALVIGKYGSIGASRLLAYPQLWIIQQFSQELPFLVGPFDVPSDLF